MTCPKLNELPPAPEGRVGFPWTEESSAPSLPHATTYPRISIVTPSYNQGQYIEETIRSVLLQGYPDLEFIIMDGGSTDETVDIIKKYEKHLAYWTSQPDGGQADAVVKALARATGEVEAYLNSDDILTANALQQIGKLFAEQPETVWMSGACLCFDTETSEIYYPRFARMPDFIFGQSMAQQSTFWRATARRAVGFDSTFQFCLDTAFFTRLLDAYGAPAMYTHVWSGFRLHESAKTSTIQDVWFQDQEKLAAYWMKRYTGWRRVWLKHVWKAWRVKTAFSSFAQGQAWYGRKLTATDTLKIVASYPPGLLNRMTLGAVRRMF